MSPELCCHGIDRICCELHLTSHIDIPDETIREFINECMSENELWNRIIGEIYINSSAQFIGLPEFLGRVFLFIDNPRDPDATTGWVSIGSMNINENWVPSVHTSPNNSPRSPVWYHPVKSCDHDDFFHHWKLECLWRQHNYRTEEQGRMIVCANIWVCRRQQNRDIFMKNSDRLAPQ